MPRARNLSGFLSKAGAFLSGFIFFAAHVSAVTQVYKGRPKGKMADDIRFDCGVKIHTKGYRAYCQGRYTDDAEAYFTIWEEGAAKYYLTE